MKNWKLSALLNTPLGVVVVVGLLILAVEFLIMLAIVSMHNVILYDQVMEEIVAGIIDPILLTLIVSPALYFLVFRKIQESEQYLRQINASAQDAIIIANEQVRITEWNLAAQKIFGYSREEAVGQQLHQLIAPPRFHADAERGFASFLETGEGPVIGKTIEIAALRKDGNEFPVELSISPVKAQGRWHAMGVIRDITERKKAEETLQVQHTGLEMRNAELQRMRAEQEVSRARYVDLYDLAPLGYCTVAGETGLILQANLTAAAMLGVARGALIKQQISRFILPEDQDIYHLFYKKLFKLGEPQSCEVRMVKNDGTQFWTSLSATATQDENCAPVARVALSDITERKRIEDALRNTEQQYRTMIESSNDMIWTLAADGRFTFINQQAADVTGRSIQDWLGKTFEPLVLEEDLPMVLEIHGKLMKGEKIHYEVRGKKADGGILTLSVNASPIFKDGKVSGTISFASDITERKLAEAQLAEHVEELRRWHDITLGREMRTIELKREVNELLGQAGQPPRYPSAGAGAE